MDYQSKCAKAVILAFEELQKEAYQKGLKDGVELVDKVETWLKSGKSKKDISNFISEERRLLEEE